MSVFYRVRRCKCCKRFQAGKASKMQMVFLHILLVLGIIPGIIYFIFAQPARCHICGVRRKIKPIYKIQTKLISFWNKIALKIFKKEKWTLPEEVITS